MTSPTRVVDQALIDALVELGGYPHPLFHPTPEQRAQGQGAPLMGQGVLLLAGGLAEQTGALDDAIALLGFSDVSFRTMLRAGASVHLVMEHLSTTPTSSGKRRSEYRWTVLDDSDGVVLEATAVLLRTPLEDPNR